MRGKIKKIIKTILFFGCFLVGLYFIYDILKFKYPDGVKPMENFYDLPEDTVDVLLLGSSHMGMNVNPSILWDEQGIAAYVCWGGMQPTWNTYYYLKECLKFQEPKLIVMDTYLAVNDLEYSAYENSVKNVQGMRLSANKLEAIEAGVEPEYRSSVLLGLPTFHYRYGSLTSEDFGSFFWNKSTEIQTIESSGGIIQPITIRDTSDITGTAELTEKLGRYFYMIIDYCKEKDIPLLLVTSPYDVQEIEQKRYNKIAEIAEENGIEFLNFNNFYEEAGIDPQTDFRDPGHLNDSGILRYSTYLANYLKQNYELPDRRQDDNHIWAHKRETTENLVYALSEQFIGGGLNYVDTGVKLYENPFASYTILTEISTECDSGDKVWMSCFSEQPDNYTGLLVNKNDGKIYVIFNSVSRIEITEYGETLKLAIVKNGLNYKVYADGSLAGELTLDKIIPYEGSLLLGCQVNEEGKKFRYSSTDIKALEVYDISLEEKDAAEWEPEELPAPQEYQAPAAGSAAEYELAQQFNGDGTGKYLDTGIPLYQDPEDSWTVLAQFSESADTGAGVYFSCFCEEESNYRGLLVRRLEPGTINIMFGNHSTNVQVEKDSDIRLAVTKDRSAYNIYINGKKVISDEMSAVDEYKGNLLIGCQETAEGEKFRFSDIKVYNLEVYEGIVEEERIVEWKPEFKEEQPAKEPSAVDYTLPYPFLGDGVSAFIDTGIQLYDTADKNWTLKLKFRKGDAGGQILAACFAEDPTNYRGLIVNILDESTLSLTLGQTAKEIELPPQPESELEIIKTGYLYTVILNGETVLENVESRAGEYEGTLHLGCAVDIDGNEFRFSKAEILEMTVSDNLHGE